MRKFSGRLARIVWLAGGFILFFRGAGAAAPSRETAGHPNRRGSEVVVRDIQASSTLSSDRIVLAVDEKIHYKHARLENPPRIYLDLQGAGISRDLAAKAEKLSGGPVGRIRMARRNARNTRLVLNLKGPAEYSVYSLPNPERLVVYVRNAGSSPEPIWKQVPSPKLPPAATAALVSVKQSPAIAEPQAANAAPIKPPVVVQPQLSPSQATPSQAASGLDDDTERDAPSYASSAAFDFRPRVARSSFHLRRPDLPTLYKAIGDAFGIKILMDKDLPPTRFVSDFQVEDVSLHQALEAAANISHTFVAPVDQVTGIAASDTAEKRGEYERQVLRSFSVDEQSTAQEMTEVVTALQTMVDLRRIAQDPRSNSITVLGRSRQVAVAERFLGTLQKERGEVSLDVQVLEVDSQMARQLGILPPQTLQLLYLAMPSSVLTTPLFMFGGGQSLFGIQLPGASAALTFSSSAVRSRQKLQLRAASGQEASMLVGDRVPVLNGYLSSNALVQTGSQSATTSPFVGATPSIEYQDVGLKVKATPFLHAGKELTLKFDLELRALTSQSLNGAPVISNRQVTEQVRLRDGETYLMGGILDQSQVASLNGTPGLARIPWLGSLFGIHENQKTDTEFLLLIRPHVVRPSPAQEYASNSIYFGKEMVGLPAAPAPPPPQSELPNPGRPAGQLGAPQQRGVPPGLQPGIQPGTQPGTQPGAQPGTAPGTQQVQPGPQGQQPQIFTQPGAPQFPPGFMPGLQPQPAQPQPTQPQPTQ